MDLKTPCKIKKMLCLKYKDEIAKCTALAPKDSRKLDIKKNQGLTGLTIKHCIDLDDFEAKPPISYKIENDDQVQTSSDLKIEIENNINSIENADTFKESPVQDFVLKTENGDQAQTPDDNEIKICESLESSDNNNKENDEQISNNHQVETNTTVEYFENIDRSKIEILEDRQLKGVETINVNIVTSEPGPENKYVFQTRNNDEIQILNDHQSGTKLVDLFENTHTSNRSSENKYVLETEKVDKAKISKDQQAKNVKIIDIIRDDGTSKATSRNKYAFNTKNDAKMLISHDDQNDNEQTVELFEKTVTSEGSIIDKYALETEKVNNTKISIEHQVKEVEIKDVIKDIITSKTKPVNECWPETKNDNKEQILNNFEIQTKKSEDPLKNTDKANERTEKEYLSNKNKSTENKKLIVDSAKNNNHLLNSGEKNTLKDLKNDNNGGESTVSKFDKSKKNHKLTQSSTNLFEIKEQTGLKLKLTSEKSSTLHKNVKNSKRNVNDINDNINRKKTKHKTTNEENLATKKEKENETKSAFIVNPKTINEASSRNNYNLREDLSLRRRKRKLCSCDDTITGIGEKSETFKRCLRPRKAINFETYFNDKDIEDGIVTRSKFENRDKQNHDVKVHTKDLHHTSNRKNIRKTENQILVKQEVKIQIEFSRLSDITLRKIINLKNLRISYDKQNTTLYANYVNISKETSELLSKNPFEIYKLVNGLEKNLRKESADATSLGESGNSVSDGGVKSMNITEKKEVNCYAESKLKSSSNNLHESEVTFVDDKTDVRGKFNTDTNKKEKYDETLLDKLSSVKSTENCLDPKNEFSQVENVTIQRLFKLQNTNSTLGSLTQKNQSCINDFNKLHYHLKRRAISRSISLDSYLTGQKRDFQYNEKTMMKDDKIDENDCPNKKKDNYETNEKKDLTIEKYNNKRAINDETKISSETNQPATDFENNISKFILAKIKQRKLDSKIDFNEISNNNKDEDTTHIELFQREINTSGETKTIHLINNETKKALDKNNDNVSTKQTFDEPKNQVIVFCKENIYKVLDQIDRAQDENDLVSKMSTMFNSKSAQKIIDNNSDLNNCVFEEKESKNNSTNEQNDDTMRNQANFSKQTQVIDSITKSTETVPYNTVDNIRKQTNDYEDFHKRNNKLSSNSAENGLEEKIRNHSLYEKEKITEKNENQHKFSDYMTIFTIHNLLDEINNRANSKYDNKIEEKQKNEDIFNKTYLMDNVTQNDVAQIANKYTEEKLSNVHMDLKKNGIDDSNESPNLSLKKSVDVEMKRQIRNNENALKSQSVHELGKTEIVQNLKVNDKDITNLQQSKNFANGLINLHVSAIQNETVQNVPKKPIACISLNNSLRSNIVSYEKNDTANSSQYKSNSSIQILQKNTICNVQNDSMKTKLNSLNSHKYSPGEEMSEETENSQNKEIRTSNNLSHTKLHSYMKAHESRALPKINDSCLSGNQSSSYEDQSNVVQTQECSTSQRQEKKSYSSDDSNVQIYKESPVINSFNHASEVSKNFSLPRSSQKQTGQGNNIAHNLSSQNNRFSQTQQLQPGTKYPNSFSDTLVNNYTPNVGVRANYYNNMNDEYQFNENKNRVMRRDGNYERLENGNLTRYRPQYSKTDIHPNFYSRYRLQAPMQQFVDPKKISPHARRLSLASQPYIHPSNIPYFVNHTPSLNNNSVPNPYQSSQEYPAQPNSCGKNCLSNRLTPVSLYMLPNLPNPCMCMYPSPNQLKDQ